MENLSGKQTKIFLNKVLNSEYSRVFSLTSLSTLIKFLSGIISTKFVAVLIGPTGVALLGQLRSFNAVIQTLASGGLNSGIVKYSAEYKDSEKDFNDQLSTALAINAILTSIFSICLIAFSSFFSVLILFTNEYLSVFIIFGITLPLYILNGIILSVLNGLKQFKKYVTINIITSLAGTLFTVLLVYFFNIKGALISAVTFQSFVLIITLFYSKNEKWIKVIFSRFKLNRKYWKNFSKFSLMALASAVATPITDMLIRHTLTDSFSLTSTGCWEGINRISTMYLMVFTVSFSVYFLPRFAELKTNNEIKYEIKKAIKVFSPLILIISVIIYLLRNDIVLLLFSGRFDQMNDLFLFQLIGDNLRILSVLFAYLCMAKAWTGIFIFSELFFNFLYWFLMLFLIKNFGLMGSTISFAITYTFSLIYFLIVIKAKLK